MKEKNIFNFSDLSEKDKEKLKDAFQKSNGKFFALMHPFFITTAKEPWLSAFNLPEKGRMDYIRRLNSELKGLDKPLVIFSEFKKTRAMKEIFKGMGLKVPIVFIETQMASSRLHTKSNILLKDAEELRKKLKSLGAKEAHIGGELGMTADKQKFELEGGCAKYLKDLLSESRYFKQTLRGPKLKTKFLPRVIYPGSYGKKKKGK